MGADGGLNLVRLKDPSKRDRAVELIAPLGLLDYSWRDEDEEYIKNNPLPDDIILSKYGTDMSHCGMRDLYYIFAEFEPEYRNDWLFGIYWTFEDIVLNLMTCPEWQLFNLSTLERQIIRQCSNEMYYKYVQKEDFMWREFYQPEPIERDMKYIESLKDIWKMTIGDWVSELKELLYWKNVAVVETWT